MSSNDTPNWQKSPYTDGVMCVEVADQDGQVLLRDDGRPDVVVTMTPDAWDAFTRGVKDGHFDNIG